FSIVDICCHRSPTLPSFFFYCYVPHRNLHSFPTRRSSDLQTELLSDVDASRISYPCIVKWIYGFQARNVYFVHSNQELDVRNRRDRKSTRLNSSHVEISYAVFCLKKKKKK